MRTQADRDDDLAIGRELERKDEEISRLRAALHAIVADPDNAPLVLSDSHSLTLIENGRAALAYQQTAKTEEQK